MNDTELLNAISDMLDAKLKPIYGQLDRLGDRVGQLEDRVGRLEESVARFEDRGGQLEECVGRLEKRVEQVEIRINSLEERGGHVERLIEFQVVPRMSTIESCYISTFERYKTYADRMETAFRDINVIKTVVTGHSEKLQKIS